MTAYGSALEALADPTRRAVFERLRRGPLSVAEIAQGMPVTRPAVSQHLRVLKDAGLVRDRREGTRRLYAIESRGLDDLRRYLERFWDDVLTRYAEHADADGRKSWASTRRSRRSGAR